MGISNPSSVTLTAPTVQTFTTNGSQTGWLFTVSSANATAGATYTNNAHTFTVLSTIASGTTLFMSGVGSLSGVSGTLTKASGTGDSTITYSAAVTLSTYTTPTSPPPLFLDVEMVGAGSGGAGSGNSGAGNSSPGTATVFGTALLIANGGSATTSGIVPGAGGTVSVASPAIDLASRQGGSGGAGGNQTGTSAQQAGGVGASSPLGGAGAAGYGGGTNGSAGGAAIPNTGSGGGGSGGGSTTGTATGAGGAAGGYVRALIPSPAATYFYTIGIEGNFGAAGTNGSAGGLGARGAITVTEHYQ